ncbi:MAG: hypothetical protein DDT22_01180 [candidate division WS2 bacterium]|nr:hypothetical protein [Candidatus Lithacetigena glycinireducens]
MIIKSDRITIKMLAGAPIVRGQAVHLSAPRTVAPSLAANGPLIVGVADESVSAGAPVDIVIKGVMTGVADGPIAVGDRVGVGPGVTTPGRVVAITTAGQIIGKALSSATAGGSVDILVSLA